MKKIIQLLAVVMAAFTTYHKSKAKVIVALQKSAMESVSVTMISVVSQSRPHMAINSITIFSWELVLDSNSHRNMRLWEWNMPSIREIAMWIPIFANLHFNFLKEKILPIR